MKISNDKQMKCSCSEDGASRKNYAEQSDSHSRKNSALSSGSTIKPSLMVGLFLLLIIMSIAPTSESRRIPKKDRANRTESRSKPGENDIVPRNPVKTGRRQGKRKILKTSEEALIITESIYLKKDWCHSRPLKQEVRTKNGCKGIFINKFCYGQCNSFYIPKPLTADEKKQAAFQSCSFCQPHIEDKVSVTLRCPRKGGRRRKIKRTVSRIVECRCVAVPDIQSRMATPASTSAALNSSAEVSRKSSR